MDDQDERVLRAELMNNVHLIKFEPGKLEIRLAEAGNPDTPKRLSKFLNSITQVPWSVLLTTEEGSPTFNDQKVQEEKVLHSEVMKSTAMQSVLEKFPGAKIQNVRHLDDFAMETSNNDIEKEKESP